MTPLFAVTLDVGGSHVTAARVDLQARRVTGDVARLDVPHTAGLDDVLASWVQAALEVAGTGPVTHLGFAVPGPFNLRGGVSLMTHKFAALHGVPLREALAARLRGTPLAGVPVCFGNDADLFALGEWWAGAGEQQDLIGVTLGTGLGSGFVRDGQVVTDGPGVPEDGELWSTPFRDGLAEAYASGAAVTRLAQAMLGETLSARDLAALEPERAAPVWAAFGGTLADLLSPWVAAFGARRVVLGGNVSRAFPHFALSLQAGLPSGTLAVQSRHFELAALLGAARLSVPVPDQPV
ncbi:ROK family protein [Deinococcus aquiradiocola]|uniref:Glucokinase n=1 Tax=Deinococcus aquiradiocola TaxID=393059 RepID=A0A917UQR6_9DEIO|nr:ROK family protein [Deinococcus aquiradiocola]GGJ76358.1 glucokinase [Deinococcus aquiradiocola]